MNNNLLKQLDKILYVLNKAFEIYIGWIFINGRKQKKYNQYLKNKYNLK